MSMHLLMTSWGFLQSTMLIWPAYNFVGATWDCARDKRRALEHCDLVQGPVNDLGNATCHFIFSFHFLTARSSAAHAMISAGESMNVRPVQGVRHIPSPPKIPSFPPPLLPYFPNDSVHLVKRNLTRASWRPLKCKAIFHFDPRCSAFGPEKSREYEKMSRCPDLNENLLEMRELWLFVCSRCRDGRKCPTYFSVFSIWIQNLCSSASHVFSYLQPRQQESLELFNKLHSSPLCHRQNRKSGFCPREMASKTHLVLSVLSNPIPTPSHVPMWGFAAPQNRLGNSTNDLPGKSQRAAITRSFADAPLLHGAHVWFLSGRPSFSLLFASALTSLLSLAHFAVCVTYFLSFLYSLPLSLTLFQPSGPPLFLSWACLFLHHTSASPFTSKYALVGCESCSNGRNDCVLHTQSNNKSGVPFTPPPSALQICMELHQ